MSKGESDASRVADEVCDGGSTVKMKQETSWCNGAAETFDPGWSQKIKSREVGKVEERSCRRRCLCGQKKNCLMWNIDLGSVLLKERRTGKQNCM
jgi:hypothetical protein